MQESKSKYEKGQHARLWARESAQRKKGKYGGMSARKTDCMEGSKSKERKGLHMRGKVCPGERKRAMERR